MRWVVADGDRPGRGPGRRCRPRCPETARRRRTTRGAGYHAAGAEDVPADVALTDAALTTAEQRAAAHRRYRDTVDHTDDVARIKAGEDAQAGAQEAQPSGATACDDQRERNADQDRKEADQDRKDSQRRGAGDT